MAGLVEMMFGCWHKNTSFPRTAKAGERRKSAAQLTGTYIVCLDCGKEFAYDWNEMRMISATEEKRMVRAAAAGTAATFEAAEGKAA